MHVGQCLACHVFHNWQLIPDSTGFASQSILSNPGNVATNFSNSSAHGLPSIPSSFANASLSACDCSASAKLFLNSFLIWAQVLPFNSNFKSAFEHCVCFISSSIISFDALRTLYTNLFFLNSFLTENLRGAAFRTPATILGGTNRFRAELDNSTGASGFGTSRQCVVVALRVFESMSETPTARAGSCARLDSCTTP